MLSFSTLVTRLRCVVLGRASTMGWLGASIAIASESLGQTSAPSWKLTTTRIVPIAAPDGTPATSLNGVILTARGDMVVALADVPTILLMRPDGKARSYAGRRGAGPGEFARISGIATLGDSIVAADPNLNRFSVFALDTSSVRFFRAVPMRRTLAALLQGGNALCQPLPLAQPDLINAPWPLMLCGWDGEVRDTITIRRHPRSAITFTGPQRSINVLRVEGLDAFDDTPLWRLTPGGAAFVIIDRPAATSPRTAQYSVTVIDAAGDTVRGHPYRSRPRAIPASHVNSVVDELSEVARRSFPSLEAARSVIRPAVKAPPYYPPVSQAFVSTDGRIWLRTEAKRTAVQWRVLDTSGQTVALVSEPSGIRLEAATATMVLGTQDTDDGVRLVQFKIETP